MSETESKGASKVELSKFVLQCVFVQFADQLERVEVREGGDGGVTTVLHLKHKVGAA